MRTVQLTTQEMFDAIGFLGGTRKGLELELDGLRATGSAEWIIRNVEGRLVECDKLLNKLREVGL